MEQDGSDQEDTHYEQKWQAQVDYEMRTRQTLAHQQQEEKAQSYLNEINSGERVLLAAQHEAACRAQVQQHRAMRIALRKSHQQ